ncbi:hypothetical protein F5878DRAFT_149212 [Lentinula raphanica]|uniref:GLTSCR protein conserved domain-containing protein n=1 Tax=Lentinula raphanica TaxID=153919 RepID=A0AA38P9R2_9AGAR|nr:hypothetical protein F5878DRAFT_149212 [Lentinula raphanica]
MRSRILSALFTAVILLVITAAPLPFKQDPTPSSELNPPDIMELNVGLYNHRRKEWVKLNEFWKSDRAEEIISDLDPHLYGPTLEFHPSYFVTLPISILSNAYEHPDNSQLLDCIKDIALFRAFSEYPFNEDKSYILAVLKYFDTIHPFLSPSFASHKREIERKLDNLQKTSDYSRPTVTNLMTSNHDPLSGYSASHRPVPAGCRARPIKASLPTSDHSAPAILHPAPANGHTLSANGPPRPHLPMSEYPAPAILHPVPQANGHSLPANGRPAPASGPSAPARSASGWTPTVANLINH